MRSADWDRRWEEKALHVHGEPSTVVTAALDELEPGSALDLGCGAGRNAIWLAEHGWTVTAVDFSDVALRQARARAPVGGIGVEWVRADLLEYEPSAAFDLVLVAYVHLPAEEHRRLLAKAGTALAPGGVLLVVGHDVENVGTGAPGPSDRTLLYRPDDVAAELSGLEIERAESVHRPVELEDGSSVEAVDALVLARRPA